LDADIEIYSSRYRKVFVINHYLGAYTLTYSNYLLVRFDSTYT